MTDFNRTPAEKRVIDKVAESRGREWVKEHAEPIIAQARLVGELE